MTRWIGPGGRRRTIAACVACAALLAVVVGHVARVLCPPIERSAPSAAPSVTMAADLPRFRFAFVGDTHATAGERLEPLLAAVAAERPKFVLHLGDVVDQAMDRKAWQDFCARTARHGLRVFPVQGNHDRPRRGESPPLLEHFAELPDTCYAFQVEGLRFLMLDSERTLASGSCQGRFLRSHLADPAATPSVICLHRPVFTSSRRDWPRMLWTRYWLHGQARGSSVCLVLSGHNHYYERLARLEGVTYVVSGGGAHNPYRAGAAGPYRVAHGEGSAHFGIVDVYEDRLELRVRTVAGETWDRASVFFARRLRPRAEERAAPFARGASNRPGGTEVRPGLSGNSPAISVIGSTSD